MFVYVHLQSIRTYRDAICSGSTRQLYAIQNHIFSSMLRGTCSGHTSASSAALPDHISASAGLTILVRLKIFQNR